MSIVLATGDIAPDRPDADQCFDGTRAVLTGADLVFGQLATSFADSGRRLPQARHAVLTSSGGDGPAEPSCYVVGIVLRDGEAPDGRRGR